MYVCTYMYVCAYVYRQRDLCLFLVVIPRKRLNWKALFYVSTALMYTYVIMHGTHIIMDVHTYIHTYIHTLYIRRVKPGQLGTGSTWPY